MTVSTLTPPSPRPPAFDLAPDEADAALEIVRKSLKER
jgi:hypothetical protein